MVTVTGSPWVMAPVEPVAVAMKVCLPLAPLVRPLQLQFPASSTTAEQICFLPSVTVTVFPTPPVPVKVNRQPPHPIH